MSSEDDLSPIAVLLTSACCPPRGSKHIPPQELPELFHPAGLATVLIPGEPGHDDNPPLSAACFIPSFMDGNVQPPPEGASTNSYFIHFDEYSQKAVRTPAIRGRAVPLDPKVPGACQNERICACPYPEQSE